MKKRNLFFLAAVLVFLLAGCSSFKNISPYSVAADEITFTVDPENSTIFDGENTYHYDFSETASGYQVEIKYPNGAFYWWNMQRTGLGVGGHDENYDESRFAAGGTLLDVLEKELPRRKSSKSIPLIILLFCVGILDAVWPRAVWHLTVGWQCKDGGPSDLALKWIRLSGVIAVIAAVVVIFV